MGDITRSGRTIIFVSHNETAIRQLCTSAVLLHQGSLVIQDTPSAVFAQYRVKRVESGFSPANRTQSSPEVQIINATLSIDGVVTNEFPAGFNPVLSYTLAVKTAIRCTVEMLCRDENGFPILFAPIGLSTGNEYELSPGEHSLTFLLKLPYLASGRYALDLMVVEPKVKFYDYS